MHPGQKLVAVLLNDAIQFDESSFMQIQKYVVSNIFKIQSKQNTRRLLNSNGEGEEQTLRKV
jgi:hypothetical protein